MAWRRNTQVNKLCLNAVLPPLICSAGIHRVPLVVTDYCQAALEQSMPLLQHCAVRSGSDVCVEQQRTRQPETRFSETGVGNNSDFPKSQDVLCGTNPPNHESNFSDLQQYITLSARPNPFRQPLQQSGHGTRLPTFSNGFLMAMNLAQDHNCTA